MMRHATQGFRPPRRRRRPGSASAPCPARSPPPRSSPTPKSALIVVDVQNCFVDRRHAAGQGRRAGRAGDQQALGGVRERRRHAGLAHRRATSRSPRRTPARSRSRRPSSPTAPRCSGPTTACRAPQDAALLKDLTLPKAQLIIRKGYHQGDRQLLGVHGGRRQDLDRPGRVPEGARRRHRSTSAAWRPTSASPGPRSMRARPASRPT